MPSCEMFNSVGWRCNWELRRDRCNSMRGCIFMGSSTIFGSCVVDDEFDLVSDEEVFTESIRKKNLSDMIAETSIESLRASRMYTLFLLKDLIMQTKISSIEVDKTSIPVPHLHLDSETVVRISSTYLNATVHSEVLTKDYFRRFITSQLIHLLGYDSTRRTSMTLTNLGLDYSYVQLKDIVKNQVPNLRESSERGLKWAYKAGLQNETFKSYVKNSLTSLLSSIGDEFQ